MNRATIGVVFAAAAALAGCGGTTNNSTGSGGASGTPTPAASSAAGGGIADTAAGYDGTYTGTWKNTTFGSTGAANAVVTTNKDSKTTGIKLTLSGNVFGSGVQPELITGQLSDSGGFSFTGHSTTFGDVSKFTIAPDGTLTLSATNTSPRVTKFEASGKVDKSSFTLNYTATLSTGPATGTFTLTK